MCWPIHMWMGATVLQFCHASLFRYCIISIVASPIWKQANCRICSLLLKDLFSQQKLDVTSYGVCIALINSPWSIKLEKLTVAYIWGIPHYICHWWIIWLSMVSQCTFRCTCAIYISVQVSNITTNVFTWVNPQARYIRYTANHSPKRVLVFSWNKWEPLFAERGKFDYTRSARQSVGAYEKYHCCLKSQMNRSCSWRSRTTNMCLISCQYFILVRDNPSIFYFNA
jgi:hypothetical protein